MSMADDIVAGSKPMLKGIRTQARNQIIMMDAAIAQARSPAQRGYYTELREYFSDTVESMDRMLAKIAEFEALPAED